MIGTKLMKNLVRLKEQATNLFCYYFLVSGGK